MYREQRNPMFVFTLDGELFRLSVKTPELDPLFQLPPRIKPRCIYDIALPIQNYFFFSSAVTRFVSSFNSLR